ncbi:MOONR protein, partial [Atractosteus spatula]|nr:MOONR protein [Atractosteus spatula]
LFVSQLRFNRAVPAAHSNLTARFHSPAPIVIEKLTPPGATMASGRGADSVSSSQSSLRFSVVSEERLQQAVRLAQRDLRRGHQESLLTPNGVQPPAAGSEKSKTQDGNTRDQLQPKRGAQKASAPKAVVTRPGARVLVYTPERLGQPPKTEHGQSPPTRDTGPGLNRRADSQEPQLSQEIRRLQKELSTYVQRIEQLAQRGPVVVGPVDPEEERRAQVRRQEQAARAARVIYVLQQQVKEVQEDLDKLSTQRIRHTKKSRAMDRLAAAHRGAVRALQVFVNQLPDQSEDRALSHYKELGHLIRQLSLCSAKLESGSSSSVPETAVDILQKLEALESLLGKQELGSPGRGGSRAQSSSPPARRPPRGRQHSASPPRGTRGPAARGRSLRAGQRPAVAKRILPEKINWQESGSQVSRKKSRLRIGVVSNLVQHEAGRMIPLYLSKKKSSFVLLLIPAAERGSELCWLVSTAGGKPPATGPAEMEDPPTPDRSEVLRAGLKSLIRIGALSEQTQPLPAQQRGVLLPERPKEQRILPRDAGFQQPTLSSRLKENQPPQKDTPAPWIPPSPTSPRATGARRASRKKEGAGVHFCTQKASAAPPVLEETPGNSLGQDRKQQAHREALRQAWLDKETTRRLKELNQLSREEAERIQRLRGYKWELASSHICDSSHITLPLTTGSPLKPSGTETDSPTRWAERAETLARERLQPLLERAEQISDSWERKGNSLRHRLSVQAADRAGKNYVNLAQSSINVQRDITLTNSAAAASADVLSEALLEDLLEDTAQALRALEEDRKMDRAAQAMQEAPTLENMLLRMEEMEADPLCPPTEWRVLQSDLSHCLSLQKDHEAVRQRCAHIAYSDARFWAEEDRAGTVRSPVNNRPVSPRPIRVTRPVLRQEPVVDIVLEPPVETERGSSLSLPASALQSQQGEGRQELSVSEISVDGLSSLTRPQRPPTQATEKCGTLLSLPVGMQNHIQRYCERYEAYLRLISHEALGNFNPWAIADSLAEELMSEALDEVAAEFQDVCEEYAEAVFTSEFLQPTESPASQQ